MGTRCKKETCRNSKKELCEKFTQDDCHKVFQRYWNSGNKAAQDTFLHSVVDVVERKLPLKETSRRQHSRIYHLKRCGSSLEVCKDMFLNTLDISQKVIECVVLDGKENCGITSPVVKPRNPRPAKGFNWTDEDQIFLK